MYIWTECYATLAAILSTAFPAKAPHFFAYLRMITKASRTFKSSAWASYDMAYHRQAANRGSLDRGMVDATALYNDAFAGRTKQFPRCQYCLSDTYSSQECQHAPELAMEGRQTQGASRQSGQPPKSTSAVDMCRLYNSPGSSRCRFRQCRFVHLCARCRQPPSSGRMWRRAASTDPAGSGSYSDRAHCVAPPVLTCSETRESDCQLNR